MVMKNIYEIIAEQKLIIDINIASYDLQHAYDYVYENNYMTFIQEGLASGVKSIIDKAIEFIKTIIRKIKELVSRIVSFFTKKGKTKESMNKDISDANKSKSNTQNGGNKSNTDNKSNTGDTEKSEQVNQTDKKPTSGKDTIHEYAPEVEEELKYCDQKIDEYLEKLEKENEEMDERHKQEDEERKRIREEKRKRSDEEARKHREQAQKDFEAEQQRREQEYKEKREHQDREYEEKMRKARQEVEEKFKKKEEERKRTAQEEEKRKAQEEEKRKRIEEYKKKIEEYKAKSEAIKKRADESNRKREDLNKRVKDIKLARKMQSVNNIDELLKNSEKQINGWSYGPLELRESLFKKINESANKILQMVQGFINNPDKINDISNRRQLSHMFIDSVVPEINSEETDMLTVVRRKIKDVENDTYTVKDKANIIIDYLDNGKNVVNIIRATSDKVLGSLDKLIDLLYDLEESDKITEKQCKIASAAAAEGSKKIASVFDMLARLTTAAYNDYTKIADRVKVEYCETI